MSDHDEQDGDEDQGEHQRKHGRHKGEIVQLSETKTGDAPKLSEAASAPSGGLLAMMERARDVMTVRRVYGDPIEKDGVTIIPAAKVFGGGGGGGGEGPNEQGGWGGGFGVSASPAGAYVIKDGRVRWEPALDLGRIVFVGQLLGIVFFLTVRSVAKAFAKRK
jgi:uncharacterized spore protein YtfJ